MSLYKTHRKGGLNLRRNKRLSSIVILIILSMSISIGCSKKEKDLERYLRDNFNAAIKMYDAFNDTNRFCRKYPIYTHK